MPEFLVSAATGALGPVLGKLAALLGDEYKRFRGVRGEVKFLIRELEAMHAFLLKKSEEENPDAQDKAWMKEVRELSYDIEDSLDDFRVRVGDDDSAKPDGFIDKCKNLLAKTKARRRIAKAIQDLKVQVREVSERNARYKQISVNTNHKTVDRRALAIFEDASRLVGIDRPKQEVISFLKKEDGGISSQQPKMVSIVGIGGIGKTTLADRVYQELKDQFDCRAFLSVSRNPNVDNILRTILSQVTGRAFYTTEAASIQQLVMEIREFLQTKRTTCCPTTEDEWKNRKFTLTPRRRRAVDTTQPKPSSSIADLSEQEPVRVLPENVVICTSGGDDKMSSSTTDDITGQPLAAAAALPLPTDLSFTMNQQGASPGLGRRRHGQQRRRSRVPNHIKGTSGAATTASDILGPRLIAAPHQQQGAFVPPYFTFSSGSPPNAKAEKQAMDCHEPSQHDNIATAFSRAFYGLPLDSDHPGSSDTGIVGFCIQTCRSSTTDDNTGQPLAAALQLATDLSFTMHQQGASPDLGRRRHGQQHIKGTSGAATTTSDILGPRLIAAPHQQQGAFVPPYFTFSSGSPPNAKAEKQAMDCHEPSQHDNDIANAFSSAFNGLSFHIDHPGSSDTGSSCQGGGRQEEQ